MPEIEPRCQIASLGNWPQHYLASSFYGLLSRPRVIHYQEGVYELNKRKARLRSTSHSRSQNSTYPWANNTQGTFISSKCCRPTKITCVTLTYQAGYASKFYTGPQPHQKTYAYSVWVWLSGVVFWRTLKLGQLFSWPILSAELKQVLFEKNTSLQSIWEKPTVCLSATVGS